MRSSTAVAVEPRHAEQTQRLLICGFLIRVQRQTRDGGNEDMQRIRARDAAKKRLLQSLGLSGSRE
jgi:hypothetical protein